MPSWQYCIRLVIKINIEFILWGWPEQINYANKSSTGSKLYWLDDYSNHIKSLISKLPSQTVIKKKRWWQTTTQTVLVYLGCCNKPPSTAGLINNTNLFVTGLVERSRELSGAVSYKGTDPIHQGSISWPNHLPKIPPPMAISSDIWIFLLDKKCKMTALGEFTTAPSKSLKLREIHTVDARMSENLSHNANCIS